MRNCKIILVVFVLGMSLGTASAQDAADTVMSISGVEITTSVDIAEMYIGDPINYTVAIEYDSTIELIPPPLGANLGQFDVRDYQADQITELNNGRRRNETVFTLSTFTIGDYVIPPVPMIFIMPDSSRKIMLSEAVPITVKSLLAVAGDSMTVRPLKPQHEFERTFVQENKWYMIGLAGLALIGLVVWLGFFRKKHIEKQVDLRPPWEIAFEKLALLKEARYLEEGRHKQYYFELTELSRGYLGRMYEVDALERTTEEFVVGFAEVELPGGIFDQMIVFLKYADLVKFAKQIPESERAENDYLFVHDMIESVRVDVERRREAEMQVEHSKQAEEQQPAVVDGGGQ